MVLIPLVNIFLKHNGFPKLGRQQILLLLISGVAYAFMTDAFVIALDMTSLADAFVLSSMTCIVIITGKAVLDYSILPAVGIGAIIGSLGAAICETNRRIQLLWLSQQTPYLAILLH